MKTRPGGYWFTHCSLFIIQIKYFLLIIVVISLSFVKGFGQCDGYFQVSSNGGCGYNIPLVAYEYSGSASYFNWYKKTSSGSWQYLGQSSAYNGQGNYTVYATTTTTFGVSYYNWCESPKKEIIVTPVQAPDVSGQGYSCDYGTANIQAQSDDNNSSYYLYKDGSSGYSLIESNGTGNFIINNFYDADADQYYVRARLSSSCYSNYFQIPISLIRQEVPTVTGDTYICYGSSTTLTADGTHGQYQWYRGTQTIQGAIGRDYNTGPLITSTTYYVSSVIIINGVSCESEKRSVHVGVDKPEPPAPTPVTRCGPGKVTLRTSSGFSEYWWYNQSGTKIGSSTSNSFSVSADGLSLYSVKVKNSNGCWSEMSSTASVTVTHTKLPYVYQAAPCGPGTTVSIVAHYSGDVSGDYYIEWYTSESATHPEYSVLVDQYGEGATYDVYLPTDKEYWIGVYDPATSNICRTKRTYFKATVGLKPTVSAVGYSCEYGTANIQAQSSDNIVTYNLYKGENTLPVQSSTSGNFTLSDFYENDTELHSFNYFVRGISDIGCNTDYAPVAFDLIRPEIQIGTGSTEVCNGSTTTLIATGGTEGNYRWYKDGVQLDVTGSQLTITNITDPISYYVSCLEQGVYTGVWCEGPKKQINITIIPSPSDPPLLINRQRCGPGSLVLEVSGEFASYQWYDFNDNPIAGETSSKLTVHVDQHTEIIYKVAGLSEAGCESPVVEVKATAVTNCENYIHEEIVKIPGVISDTELTALTKDEKTDKWTYFDGLGRPMQTVMQQGSSAGSDIIKPIIYDDFGRQQYEYLPYSATTGSVGHYREDVLARQVIFYQATPNIAQDASPWAKKVFEPSPLNRVVEQGAPGADWQPGTGNTIKHQYLTNAAEEKVINWQYDHDTGTINKGTDFVAGQLYVTVTVDEEGHAIREYTDKQGRTVLKKVQESETPGIDHTGWACTYYVYDDLNNLKAVIPPQAVYEMEDALPAPDYTLVNDPIFAKNWLFQYAYDARQRMIKKQVPGAEPVYMVYDQRDRLVLTQDGNQRSKTDLNDSPTPEWTFTKYDLLNRPILTGIHDTTAVLTQSEMQDVVNTHFAKSSAEWHEAVNGTIHGYTNKSYPIVDDVNKYLTVTYYDNYNFSHATNYTFVPELGNAEAFTRVKGQVTGTKTKVLDGTNNQWLESITYYDDRYRVIQSITQNHIGGIERVTNSYDFVGQVVSSLHTHGDGTTILREYDYDHVGRLLDTYHTINGGARILLSRNEYNELGELIDKKLHSTDYTTFAQSVDYRYNIRGWLIRINDSGLADAEEDYFGMELGYNNDIGLNIASKDLQYNGNISAVKWSDDGSTLGYGYQYDPMNRIKKAQSYNAALNAYNLDAIGYDLNGNIENLTRMDAAGQVMDLLDYDYGTGTNTSNQLLNVADGAHEDFKGGGFKDGSNTMPDYKYDNNGNMDQDLNKGITNIKYNHLNLPSRVEKDVDNYIEYIYDAAGVKLAQIVYEKGKLPKRMDYIGGFIYKQEDGGARELQLIQHEEGRIVQDPITENLVYEYHLKDHLGNIRTTFTTKPRTINFKLNYEDLGDDEESFENVSKIDNDIFDHTDKNGSTYTISQVLTGLENSRIGSVLAIPVGKGDEISASAFAKYVEITSDPADAFTSIASVLVTALTNGTGEVPEGAKATINNNFGSSSLIGGTGFEVENSSAPMAFLNLMFLPQGEAIVLEKDVTFAFDQIHIDATQLVGQPKNTKYDELKIENFIAPDQGYVLVYLSNEGSTLTEVHFDDLDIEVIETPVIQKDNYYPFGLTFNSWQRSTARENKWKFQGQEHIDDLGLNWDSFKWRNHQPDIGRFFNVDPLAEDYYYNSPYAFSENKVISHVELEGLESIPFYYIPVALEIWVRQKMKDSNLSPPEQKVAMQHRFASWLSRKHHIKSYNLMNALVEQEKIDGPRQGAGNALRHSLWSALMAQSGGEEFAREMGIAHEEGNPDDDAKQKEIDLANNELGILVGLENSNSTFEELAKIIIDKIANGEGMVIEDNKISKSKIDSKDQEKAKTAVDEAYINDDKITKDGGS